jgi:hypothetical protein
MIRTIDDNAPEIPDDRTTWNWRLLRSGPQASLTSLAMNNGLS